MFWGFTGIKQGLAAAPTVLPVVHCFGDTNTCGNRHGLENLTGDDVDDDNENAIDNDNDDLNIDDAGKPGTEGEDGLRLGEGGTCKGGTSRQQRSGQERKMVATN